MRPMTSVQRFLSGHNNAVRTAVLSASSVRAAEAIERTHANRAGNGRLRLVGPYTGHEATDIEVEITSAAGIPRASAPAFAGVGSGKLDVLSVGVGAPLQSITLTLADLGVPTRAAALDVREVQIRARTPGHAGNSVRITVTPQLQRTPTDRALLAAWSVGQASHAGEQWDFGGLPLSAQGELDEASPRIAFGNDPQVYRPWREFKDGAWRFGLSPELQRDLPAGAQVLDVTGGYVVTVTDGSDTETYGDNPAAPIVTFHDLLVALDASSLVQIAGVVTKDRTAGGQAAVDVPLRTSAWLLRSEGKPLTDVSVPPTARTQTVTVTCVNADTVGQERWSVAGDVDGALPGATTGVPYTSAAIAFTVPAADAHVPTGDWSTHFTPAPRSVDEGVPSVCLRPVKLGVNAMAKTVKFVYSKRPPADCDCSTEPTPLVSDKCLGLLNQGGEMSDLDPEYQTRLKDLFGWRRDFHAANWVSFYVPAKDLDFADAITSAFSSALGEIYESVPARTEWSQALTAMQADLQPLEDPQFANKLGSGNLWDGPTLLIHVSSVANMSDAPDLLGTGSQVPAIGRLSNMVQDLVRKYEARMDYCRALAGIVPKSDPSSTAAGGCWVDHGGDHWWVDAEGEYLPAFTNQAYISARRDADGKPFSTMEFGFGLVVACPDRLKEGDSITLRIRQVDGDRPYRVGDVATLQTVGAGPAWLVGGVDGTDELTWNASGSASGRLADYVMPTDGAPASAWSQAGVQLQMALGGIPFALGDTFSLDVEAGQFKWRQGGGAWSADTNIPTSGPAHLADGLDLHFDPGTAPSFVPGDAYAFAVHQPWAASHLQDASPSVWSWAGSAAVLDVDLGVERDLTALALARYDLPAGAQVSAQLSTDGVAWDAPLALDVSGPVCVHMLPAQVQARYVRLSVSDAPDGRIGWMWAGKPLATQHHASQCTRQRRWAVSRGDGVNPAALYAGRGDGWDLAWQADSRMSSVLFDNDLQALLAMLDFVHVRGEPLIFVPHHAHVAEAALVRAGDDALDVSDIHAWQPDDAGQRLMSATLRLDPVYA